MSAEEANVALDEIDEIFERSARVAERPRKRQKFSLKAWAPALPAVCFVLALALAVLSTLWVSQRESLEWAASHGVWLALGIGLVQVFIFLWGAVAGVGDAEADLALDLRKLLHEDWEAIDDLALRAPERLRFVAQRLRHEVDRRRVRLAHVAGAFEKVGMVPAVFALIFGLQSKEHPEMWIWSSASLTLFYLLILQLSTTLQNAERRAWVIEYALSLQADTNNNAAGGASVAAQS